MSEETPEGASKEAASESPIKTPADQRSEVHITLKVKSQDGNEIFFKIKRSTNLKKLMDAYCAR